MKRKRFSVEQITTVLQQAESGVPIGDLCRQVGISEQSFLVGGGRCTATCSRVKRASSSHSETSTRSSSGLSRTCRSTRACSRMCCQKSSEARQAARGRALLAGPRHVLKVRVTCGIYIGHRGS